MVIKAFLRFYWLLLCLLGLVSFSGWGFSTPSTMINLTAKAGPHSLQKITATVQDEAGFIWMGTESGLLRYDGVKAKLFKADSGSENALVDNWITDLQLDDEGYLWIATSNGLSRFELATEQFVNFRHQPQNPNPLSANRVYSLALGSDGGLWIATEKGVDRLNRNTLKIEPFELQMNKGGGNTPRRIVSRVFEDDQQRLWYSTMFRALYRYDLRTGENRYLNIRPQNPDNKDTETIFEITQLKRGGIWIGSERYLMKYNEQTERFEYFFIPIRAQNRQLISRVLRIVEDSQSTIWISTLFNGVSLLKPGSDQVENLQLTTGNSEGFFDAAVLDMLNTADGQMALAVYRQGFAFVSPQHLKFDYYLPDDNDDNPRAIFADGTKVWFAANNHLYCIEGSDNPPQLVAKDVGYISAMIRFDENRLLLSVRERGFLLYDIQSKKVTPHAGQLATLKNNFKGMTFDDKGNLWLGSFPLGRKASDGVYQYHVASDTLTLVIKNLSIHQILYYEGSLWLVTRAAYLQRYDLKTAQLHSYESLGNIVHQVAPLGSGKVGVATLQKGFAVIDVPTDKIDFFTQADGLPDNTVYGINSDKEGRIWLGGNAGLSVFHPKTQRLQSIDGNLALKFSVFTRQGLVKTEDGFMHMLLSNRIVGFSPEQLLAQTPLLQHQVLLTDFKVLNRSMLPKPLDPTSPLLKTVHYTDALELNHEDYLFSFSFTSNAMGAETPTKFAYRMFGYRNDWIETDSNNPIATFTSMPAGNYQFQVKTTLSDGSWSERAHQIDLTIIPPWYLSTAAYVTYVIAALGAILLFIRYRTEKLQRQARQMEQTIALRTAQLQQSRDEVTELLAQKERTFANISHEFKTPLTLVLTPLEVILTQQSKFEVSPLLLEQLSLIKRNGNRLLRMVEQMLELSRLDNETEQTAHHYRMDSALKHLLVSFQPLFDSKALTVSFNCDEDIFISLKGEAFAIIFTNLLSNAVKYTPRDGKITLSVAIEHNSAVIKLSDTGVGISEENQKLVFNRFTRVVEEQGEKIPGAGIGLALVKELVQSNQGTIELRSQLNRGTSISIYLPLLAKKEAKVVSDDGFTAISVSEVAAQINSGHYQNAPLMDDLKSSTLPVVLLIDDNQDMLHLLSDTLGSQYQCLLADHGEKGLKLASEYMPDLIISDVMMPGLSGFDVAQALKDNELTCHIPVILLTAKSDTASRIEGWKRDIDDYLHKPFHPQELLMRIDSLMSIRNILKARYREAIVHEAVCDHSREPAEKFEDKDTRFLERFKKVIGQHYHNCEFSKNVCAASLHISERQLTRKLNALIGEGFSEFLRDYRLNKSLEMLYAGAQMSLISDAVGFSSQAYFSQCFKAKFGKTATQYKKDLRLN